MPDDNSQLRAFAALVAKWNKHINLSAASTPEEIWSHVEDSREVVQVLKDCGRLLDVGSGGGFPSVVAAVLLPRAEIVALEPVHKKHAFLRTAARELGLANLTAIAERLEEHPARNYDAATSRATFDLGEWLALGTGYVRPGGLVVGFEAVRRNDLPLAVRRYEYTIAGKRRALVVLQRPSST